MELFFIRALIGGVGLAIIAAPFGCFIVWRRMAFFGDTIAHSALLGIAMAFLLDWNLTVGVFTVSTIIAVMLTIAGNSRVLASDTILAILAHSTLAGGLVILSFFNWVRGDLLVFLFGDILTVSTFDLAMIYGGGGVIFLILLMQWRVMLADTISPDIAKAEGVNARTAWLLFMVLLAWVIAVAIKIIGALLISSLLIIPAASARSFATGPIKMIFLAALFGSIAVIGGLYTSYYFDTPSGPSIVVVAACLFFVSLVFSRLFNIRI